VEEGDRREVYERVSERTGVGVTRVCSTQQELCTRAETAGQGLQRWERDGESGPDVA